jgi:photosystem II stability/assembly factor-like uncharacterized protein
MNFYIRLHIHLCSLILVCIACFTAVPALNAQYSESDLDWYWGNQMVPPMDVSGFHPIDDEHCWISSYSGIIAYTSNAGRLWNYYFLEPGTRINSIWFYDRENGVVVGDDGVIFRSGDGGKNWTKVESGTESNLSRVIFSDPDNGVIIGHEGVILKSFDGGITWQAIDAPGKNPDFINVAISSPQHWALIDSTYLFLTDDAGTSWEVLRATVPFTNQYLTAVDRYSEKHYAVAAASIGSNGFRSTIVITTTDKGENWSSFTAWSFNSYSLKYIDENKGYLSDRYNYFQTNDAGKTWELNWRPPHLGTHTGQFYNMRYLHMIGDIMFVIDGFGEVWKSNAEKDSWTNLRKPDNDQYWSLAAGDDVILLGSRNGILRSVDGGLTFETVYDGSGISFHRFGENNWVANSYGLYISRDNGITWNGLNTRDQNGRRLLNIKLATFTDTSKGYLVDSYPMGVYRYINEALWEKLEPLHTADIHAIHAKGDRVWLLGPGNQIQVSDDDGQTWSYQDIVYDVGLRSMTMMDENKGWIMTDSLGLLLHTTDGGNSWTPIDTGFDFQIYALDYLDEDRVWLAGSSSTILKSEDGGTTFKKQSTPAIVNSGLFTLRTMKVLSDSSGLAAGDNGVILSYGKPLHPDNNDDENGPPEVPGKLVLYQNYPNPFNPSTTIKYYLMEPATIRVEIFNVLGHRIKRLEPGLQNQGYHYISVNGGELASGMYMYAIFRDGVFSGTRKMLLVR